MERAGQFPKRIAIGPNSSGYVEGDLRRWLADRAARGSLRLSGAVSDPLRDASARKATATKQAAPTPTGRSSAKPPTVPLARVAAKKLVLSKTGGKA